MLKIINVFHFILTVTLVMFVVMTSLWSYQVNNHNIDLTKRINELDPAGSYSYAHFSLSEKLDYFRLPWLNSDIKSDQDPIVQRNKATIHEQLAALKKQVNLRQAEINHLQRLEGASRLSQNSLERLYKEHTMLAHYVLAQSEFDLAVNQQKLHETALQCEREIEAHKNSFSDLSLSYEQLSTAHNSLSLQLNVNKDKMVFVEEKFAETQEILNKEREINSIAVFGGSQKSGADTKVLIRERERLIATNKELVKILNRNQVEERQLRERTVSLERELLSLSYKLREIKLSQNQDASELLANRDEPIRLQ